MHDFAFVFAGFCVGLVVGLTGISAGSLMTPLLTFFLGVKPYVAIGTDLLFAALSKIGGTVSLARTPRVNWKLVGQMAAGSIPATLATLGVLRQLGPSTPGVQTLMATTLGIVLLLTAAATLYKTLLGNAKAQPTQSLQPEMPTQARHWVWPVLFGAFIGALVTLTSVGAGAIGVVVEMLLYPALPLQRIAAADLAHAVPLTLVAGLGHASLGSVDWSLLLKLLAGSLPGIWLGLQLTGKTPDRLIRSLLSVLMACAGVKLIAL